MESAIPDHLKTARTRHTRYGDDYTPPYPAFVARHKPSVARVVMAYFGLQFRSADEAAVAAPLKDLADAFTVHDGPGHWDRARYADEAGYETIVTIAYWDDPASFDAWFAAHGAVWAGEEKPGPLGYFTEILRPSTTRYQTLFSSVGRMEGIAVVADGLSDMVREHAYWGGMRDRIPLSQTDAMMAGGTPKANGTNGHVRIVPHENICLIRSGQDWSDTDDSERRMYLEDVEPMLRAGMEFLRDEVCPAAVSPTAICRSSDRTGNRSRNRSA